jgi:hypothetical protein
VWIWWINNCEHFRLFQLDHTSVGRHQMRYSEPKMGTHSTTNRADTCGLQSLPSASATLIEER